MKKKLQRRKKVIRVRKTYSGFKPEIEFMTYENFANGFILRGERTEVHPYKKNDPRRMILPLRLTKKKAKFIKGALMSVYNESLRIAEIIISLFNSTSSKL